MVAAGGDGPHLVQADAGGRIATSATPYFVDRVTLGGPSFNEFHTNAPEAYAPGMYVVVVPGDGTAKFGQGQYAVVESVVGDAVFVDPSFDTLPNNGDFALIIPPPAQVGPASPRPQTLALVSVDNPGAGYTAITSNLPTLPNRVVGYQISVVGTTIFSGGIALRGHTSLVVKQIQNMRSPANVSLTQARSYPQPLVVKDYISVITDAAFDVGLQLEAGFTGSVRGFLELG